MPSTARGRLRGGLPLGLISTRSTRRSMVRARTARASTTSSRRRSTRRLSCRTVSLGDSFGVTALMVDPVCTARLTARSPRRTGDGHAPIGVPLSCSHALPLLGVCAPMADPDTNAAYQNEVIDDGELQDSSAGRLCLHPADPPPFFIPTRVATPICRPVRQSHLAESACRLAQRTAVADAVRSVPCCRRSSNTPARAERWSSL
jgi:hypothetical protein